MPAVPVPLQAAPRGRVPSWLRDPSVHLRSMAVVVIVALVIGLRWFVAAHLPTYVWTRDSGSYLTPASAAMQSGQWINSARRGPVYSLFLAAVFRAGGTLTTVANVQAALGALTALITLAMGRVWLGRRGFWPWAVCAVFYALYGMPIEMERLIRNETLLTLFATFAFGAWFFALRTGSLRWFAASGLASGSMHLLKGIFPIFPLIVCVLTFLAWRRTPGRAARLAACYLILFLLPLAGSKLYDRLTHNNRPSKPEAGEMFYGRTAQWTYLDGGIVPDVKARIRVEVTAYTDRFRRTGKLDNNEIVKRTVVPTIKNVLVGERHLLPADVDHLCWRLGFEAVVHHPGEYLKQVIHDFYFLNFITAHRFTIFLPRELTTGVHDAEAFISGDEEDAQPFSERFFDLPRSRAAVHAALEDDSAIGLFSAFIAIAGHLRPVSPVFMTGLLILVLGYVTRGRERLFWLGNIVLWFYYLTLLSTVGRPLDRYLMPVLPIMFWTISTALAEGWRWVLKKDGARPVPATA